MTRRRIRRGITILEVMVGLLVLALTVVAASAMFPMSHLLRDRSSSYSKAAAIVQRKMEQVRKLPTSQLNYAGLRTAGIIDAVATVPSGSDQLYTFTTTDLLANDLNSAQGRVRLLDPGTDLVTVEVQMTWQSLRGRTETVSARTFVSDKTVWKEE
jgi:Tfp pilus assembly protein PilV